MSVAYITEEGAYIKKRGGVFVVGRNQEVVMEIPEEMLEGLTLIDGVQVSSRAMVELAEMVDVLVDGRFVETLRDTDLLFRGSANQRLIDVRRTLEGGFVCLWQRD